MGSTTPAAGAMPGADLLDRMDELCERGLPLSAFALTRPFAAPERWTGVRALRVASRLTYLLGAPALSDRLDLRAHRADPRDVAAFVRFAYHVAQRRGPVEALRRLEAFAPGEAATVEDRVSLLCARAWMLAQLRDFDPAEALVREAGALAPDSSTPIRARAFLLERQDRFADALAVAKDAIAAHPDDPRMLMPAAHLLVTFDRDEEAADLLDRASRELELAQLVWQRAGILNELRRWEEERRLLDRLGTLLPLAEEETQSQLAAWRSDCAYYLGDVAEARRQAERSGMPFMKELATRLARESYGARRRILEVPFVRQHHMTCAPATLSAIGGYFGAPVDHLEVAEAICYDGTPAHSERHWAETHGFVVREFRVTWEAAVALLDAGLPFTLTTVEATSAHLQACIGYDERRGTLYLRDPYKHFVVEAFGPELLARYAASGPRGMALVPRADASRLEKLSLPDAPLYDLLHAVERGLFEHRRADAVATYETLKSRAPAHLLTIAARRALAAYDANPIEQLAAAEQLLALHPKDTAAELAVVARLQGLSSPSDWLARVESACARREAHPVFREMLADALRADVRHHDRAARAARSVARSMPDRAQPLAILADMAWDARRFDEALRLYRFASCLSQSDEGRARSYFIAARCVGRGDDGLSFLRRRAARLRRRSGEPDLTLAWALDQLDRQPEALEVLETAMRARPDDGELLLGTAEARARAGDMTAARALLERAAPCSRRGAWLRSASNIDLYDGDFERSAAKIREALELAPLAEELHRALARRLLASEGREGVRRHLDAVTERFPHHRGLLRLAIEWKRDDDPSRYEEAIRRLVAACTNDAWALRELAFLQLDRGKLDEAAATAAAAAGIEPGHVSQHVLAAEVARSRGDVMEAREALRAAVRTDADAVSAIDRLVALADSAEERDEALAFVEAEVFGRTISGAGVSAWYTAARGHLPPERLLPVVERHLVERADRWSAWSITVAERLRAERADEAYAAARDATERFPLVPALWIDRADAALRVGDERGEIEALERAIAINPGFGRAVHRLARSHLNAGRASAARDALAKGVRHDPLDTSLHVALAELDDHTGNRELAVESLRHALRIDPECEDAWGCLARFSPDQAVAEASRLAERYPSSSAVHLAHATVLERAGRLADALAASERAIAASPRLVDAHDRRAALLLLLGRADEAKRACHPEALEPTPWTLRGREAWIVARSGDLPAAVRMMRDVVEQHPDYTWGLVKLADWCSDLGDADGEAYAAGRLVAVSPNNPVSYGFAADAALRRGDVATTKAHLRRAIALDPEYSYGGLTLAHLYADDGELDDAARIVTTLRTTAPGAFALLAEVRVAVLRGDVDRARECFRSLCELADAAAQTRDARRHLVLAGSGDRVLEDLEAMMDRPSAQPIVGILWLETLVARGEFAMRRLVARDAKLPAPSAAGARLLRQLGEKKRAFRVRWLAVRHARWFRSSDETWGWMGYALANIQDTTLAIAWLRDHARRQGARPWMLMNLAAAFRRRWLGGHAAEVHRRAARLAPEDASTARHRVWAALEDLAEGRNETALGWHATLEGDVGEATANTVRQIALAVLEFSTSGTDRRAAYLVARRRIGQLVASRLVLPLSSPLRRAHRLAAKRLARDMRSIPAVLWARQEETVLLSALGAPLLLFGAGAIDDVGPSGFVSLILFLLVVVAHLLR